MSTTTHTTARQRGFMPLTVNYPPTESALLAAAVRQLGGRPHMVVETRAGLSIWIPRGMTPAQRLRAIYRQGGHRAST